MRYLYSFLLYLALPWLFLRLWWRARRLPAYRERMGERFGFYPFRLDRCIWVHAVSVGETIAALPFIQQLHKAYPQVPILITTMTPTGSARVKNALGDTVYHVYLPYDFPGAVKRFLQAMRPIVGIIIETELWPNVIAECQQRSIPMGLMNARLSAQSAKGYQRIASLTRAMLQAITLIGAQGEADATRFIALGALPDRVKVTGNIKFDLAIPDTLSVQANRLREALGGDRFIWIAASTHAGEEDIILAAHQLLREKNPHALLILVPRHPDRFQKVIARAKSLFITRIRSQDAVCDVNTAVYVGDTMGELLLLYAVSDVVFVGGSLVDKGGHNVVEPAALSKPIITGLSLFNFAALSQLFIQEEALIRIQDETTLASELIALMQSSALRAQIGERAYRIAKANRGAIEKQVTLIKEIIDPLLSG